MKTRYHLHPAQQRLLESGVRVDVFAAGQYNGIVHPSPAPRRLAQEAAQELYRDDAAYRRAVDRNRERRGERGVRGFLRRLRLCAEEKTSGGANA